MMISNIEQYNNELFELENDIKKINAKIIYFRNLIYNPLLKSKEYKELRKEIKNMKQYNFLLKLKTRDLYRMNINTSRIKKIGIVKI